MILMAAGVVTGDIWQPVNHTTITGERGICGGGGQRPPAPHPFSQLLPLNYHHSDLGVYKSSTPSRPFEPVTGYFSPQHSLIPRRRHIASRPTATTLKVTSAWQTPLAVIMPLNQHKQGFFFFQPPPPDPAELFNWPRMKCSVKFVFFIHLHELLNTHLNTAWIRAAICHSSLSV